MASPELQALVDQVEDMVSLVERLSDRDFECPSRCPGWSVKELVAHCEGMLVRLVGANCEPFSGDAVIDRVGYYRYDPDGPREGEDPSKTFSEVIRDRVVDEVGGRNASQLRANLSAAGRSAVGAIYEIPVERVIKRSGHPPMTFGEFVASRNLEFGVHAMDIANAAGRPERVHPKAAPIITGILDGLLGKPVPEVLGWSPETYILKGTGRLQLTAGERAELGSLAARFPLMR